LSQIIDALNVTFYSPRGTITRARSQTYDNPEWETVERELLSMDSFEKPLLDLLQDGDDPGVRMLSVTGGSGVFHVQVADGHAHWSQAYDPNGSDETIEVWESDQGFETSRKYTWPIDDTIELVRYYFAHGERHPGYTWR